MKLSINNASKSYGKKVKALNDISLTIESGMFGLLGPNGAGKSSLMRSIATLQHLDEGEILFNGQNIFDDPIEFRKSLGYLPQDFGLYPKSTGWQLLNHIARLKGFADKEEREKAVSISLDKTNLWDHRHKRLRGYSGGMKQRFGIAQALIANPKVIIVDEPTAGLDPIERNKFLTLLREIGTENIVLLSTHIVDDVKDLCTDMAIMNQGEIAYRGTPKSALAELKGKIWSKILNKEEIGKISQEHTVLNQSYDVDNNLHVQLLSDVKPGPDFIPLEPTLEHFYFSQIRNESTAVTA